MKVKDLMNILQSCDPEGEIRCSWKGDSKSDEDYRAAACWCVVFEQTPNGIGEDALQSFSIIGASVTDEGDVQGVDGMICTLHLDEDYYVDSYIVSRIQEMKQTRKDAERNKK